MKTTPARMRALADEYDWEHGHQEHGITRVLRNAAAQLDALQPMIDAYRLWATNRMDASAFGSIADRAIVAFMEGK